jgi:hypothetical protein
MGKEAKQIYAHFVEGNACFVQFSLYSSMGAAIRAVKASGAYTVHTPGDIAVWYETETSEKKLLENI